MLPWRPTLLIVPLHPFKLPPKADSIEVSLLTSMTLPSTMQVRRSRRDPFYSFAMLICNTSVEKSRESTDEIVSKSLVVREHLAMHMPFPRR